MIKSVKRAEKFIADTESDLSLLPTGRDYAGSTCIVIETADVYILNNNGE